MPTFLALFRALSGYLPSNHSPSSAHLRLTRFAGCCLRQQAAEQVHVFTSFLLYMCNVVNKLAVWLRTGFEVPAGMLTLATISRRFSVLSPLTGLSGRNGGLSLKCCWRAF